MLDSESENEEYVCYLSSHFYLLIHEWICIYFYILLYMITHGPQLPWLQTAINYIIISHKPRCKKMKVTQCTGCVSAYTSCTGVTRSGYIILHVNRRCLSLKMFPETRHLVYSTPLLQSFPYFCNLTATVHGEFKNVAMQQHNTLPWRLHNYALSTLPTANKLNNKNKIDKKQIRKQ